MGNEDTQPVENEVSVHIIDQFQQALQEGKLGHARQLLSTAHVSDIAGLLEGLPWRQRNIVWKIIDPDLGGAVLAEVKDAVRIDLLQHMQAAQVVAITKDLDLDDAADILQDLPGDKMHTVLRSMDVQNRQQVISALSYPEETAGRLMNIDVIAVRSDVSLHVVARYLRGQGKIPDRTDKLMVVDRDNYYLGELPLSDILIRDPQSHVGDWMHSGDIVNSMTAINEVATLFKRHDLLSIAVTDNKNKLLGRITIDDVVDVIHDEAEHAVRSMAGLGEDDMFAPVMTSARRRMIWLGINLATVFLGSWVISQFEHTLEQWVALAILLPVVSGMGGIAGGQTLTVAIRGIALGQLARANARALLVKELLVGVLNGFVWAAIVAIIVMYWFSNISLGFIIGIAMLVNLVVAAMAGSVIPQVLKLCRIDPAIAGGVLLTTITDVIGFVVFLGLATLFLQI